MCRVNGDELCLHVLFHVVFIQHGQHGVFGDDVQVAARAILHLNQRSTCSACREIFDDIQTDCPATDNGNAFSFYVRELVQVMNHAHDGEDVAALDIDALFQPVNRREQRRGARGVNNQVRPQSGNALNIGLLTNHQH